MIKVAVSMASSRIAALSLSSRLSLLSSRARDRRRNAALALAACGDPVAIGRGWCGGRDGRGGVEIIESSSEDAKELGERQQCPGAGCAGVRPKHMSNQLSHELDMVEGWVVT